MIDMTVQLMCMVGMLENRLRNECDIEQATNGDDEYLWWRLAWERLRRLVPVHFEHAGVV